MIWCTSDLRIGVEIFSGDNSVLDVVECVNEIAEHFRIVELLGDHFRMGESLFRLRERGLEVGVYPTNDSRMIPASSRCTTRSPSAASATPPTPNSTRTCPPPSPAAPAEDGESTRPAKATGEAV